MTWQSMMIAAVTGDADYTTGSLQMPGFRLGQNYSYYGAELVQGNPVSGEAVLDILKMHNIVVLQHWPPASFLERLKKAGVKKVLLWTDFEAVPAKRYWREVQWPIWQVLAQMYPLRGTQNNSFNLTLVDGYESDPAPWPEKPHGIWINTSQPTIVTNFVEILGETVGNAGYRGIFDGFFFDSVLNRPYYGTATNAPAITPSWINLYVTAWASLINTVRSLGWEVWGNCGAKVSEYAMLTGKMDERFFNMFQNKEAAVTAIRESNKIAVAASNPNQVLCLHVETYGGAETWALNKDPDWTAMGQEIASPMGLVTARTSKWIFRPGNFPFKPGTGPGRRTRLDVA